MADVRSVENRNGDFILNARLLFWSRSLSVFGIDKSASVYRTKICVVEIVLHPFTGRNICVLRDFVLFMNVHLLFHWSSPYEISHG